MDDRARGAAGRGKPSVQEEVAPNLIPMIDIMFFEIGTVEGEKEGA